MAIPGQIINIKAPVIIAKAIDVNFHITILVKNNGMIKKHILRNYQ
ncbi:MAG: hypothetical protein NTY91_02695 [Euryarchaeota archaeon]|jgi:hypothetical protein|nr:hypothetical protein [Euryarchaeota archaeon]